MAACSAARGSTNDMSKTSADGVDSRLRVAFLFLTGAGIFLLRSPLWVAALTGALLVLSFAVRIPPRRVLRSILKLWGFTLVVLISYALVREDPSVDRWVHLGPLPLNVGAVLVGAVMVLRVISVALASQIARAGDPRAIATGLRRLWVPAVVADAMDAVLALLEGDAAPGEAGRRPGSGRGDGTGGGGGGGRGGGEERGGGGGIWAGLKSVGRGGGGPPAGRPGPPAGRA